MTTKYTPRSVAVTVYERNTAAIGKTGEVTFDILHEMWRRRTATAVPADSRKDDNRMFVPGTVTGRGNANIVSLGFLVTEVDNTVRVKDSATGMLSSRPLPPEERVSFDRAAEVLSTLGVESLLFTTYSHTPEHHKFRVLLMLDRDVAGDEYRRAQLRLHAVAAEHGALLDPVTHDPGRQWYAPLRREGHEFKMVHVTGNPLPVDAILSQAPPLPHGQPKERDRKTRLGQWIEDVLRPRVDLIDILERDGVHLERKGHYARVFSPFRDDGRRPGCIAYADHMWDFGTSEHFDAIGYVQRARGVSFFDALDHLADSCGLPRFDRKQSSRPAVVDPYPLIAALPDTLPTTGRKELLDPIYAAIATQDPEDRKPSVDALMARCGKQLDRKVVVRAVDAAGKVTDNGTPPAAEPDSRYDIVDGRLCRVWGEGDHRQEEVLVNGDLRIVERVREQLGDEQRDEFVIAGTVADGTPLPPITVPTDAYDDMSWLTPGSGGRLWIEVGRSKRDLLRHAVQTRSSFGTRTIYRDLGWHEIGGKWAFLHAGGAIGTDDPVEVRPIDSSMGVFDMTANAAHVKGGLRSLLYDLAHCAPARITGPLIASMLHGPLMPALPDRAAVVLIGRTGTRKTSLAIEAARSYGRFQRSGDLSSLEGTSTAIEAILHAAQNVPVVLDDAWPRGDSREADRQRALCRTIIHTYCNRSARRRANRDASLREARPPRCILWLTAETDIADAGEGESTSNRALKLYLSERDVDLPKLTEAQKHGDDRRAAVAAWIASLAADPSWRDGLRELHEELVVKLRARGDIIGRHQGVVASYWVALRAFYSFARQFVDREVVEPVITRLMGGVLEAAQIQARRTVHETPAARYLALLGSLLATGRARVLDREDAQLDSDATCPEIGWAVGDVLYFERAALHAAVSKLARETGAPMPPPLAHVYPDLVRSGHAEQGSDERYVGVRKVLGGSRLYVVAIREAALDGVRTTRGPTAEELAARDAETASLGYLLEPDSEPAPQVH